MKLRCERDKLAGVFALVSTVASSRTPKAVLANVRLEAAEDQVTLIATDLEIGVRSQLSGVTVETPGTVLLPVKTVGSILRESSDDELTFESDGSKLVIGGAKSHFQIPTQDPSEFPPVPAFDHAQHHEVAARFLREASRRTSYATDAESSRYALGGVLLELEGDSITMVGTDGRRMACQEGSAAAVEGHATNETTVIPTRALQLMERAMADNEGNALLAAMGNSVSLQSQNTVVVTRLVEGRYPRWQAVFPNTDEMHAIEIVAGPLLAAVRQAAILIDKDTPGVDLCFGGGRLLLLSHGASLGDSKVELPISYEGDDIRMRLDPHFLMDFLRILDPERTFQMYIKDEDTAVVCKTDDGYSYAIMPMADE